MGQGPWKDKQEKSYAKAVTRNFKGLEDRKVGEDCIPVPREVINKNSRWLSSSMVAIVSCERSIPFIPGICETQGMDGSQRGQIRRYEGFNYFQRPRRGAAGDPEGKF